MHRCSLSQHAASNVSCSAPICGAFNTLANAQCAQLLDRAFIHDVALQVGLMEDARGAVLYGKYAAKHMVPCGLYQNPKQLTPLLLHLAEVGPFEQFLEVGSNTGLTTVFISAFLRRFSSKLFSESIDLTFKRNAALSLAKGAARHCQTRPCAAARWGVVFSLRLPDDPFPRQRLRARLRTFCLIDGGHAYAPVRADYDDLASVCTYAAFHDVVDADTARTEGGGVPALWAELKQHVHANRVVEFVDQPQGGAARAMGIGLLLPNAAGTVEPDRPLPPRARPAADQSQIREALKDRKRSPLDCGWNLPWRYGGTTLEVV